MTDKLFRKVDMRVVLCKSSWSVDIMMIGEEIILKNLYDLLRTFLHRYPTDHSIKKKKKPLIFKNLYYFNSLIFITFMFYLCVIHRQDKIECIL